MTTTTTCYTLPVPLRHDRRTRRQLPPITANERLHHMTRHHRTATLRAQVTAYARARHVPAAAHITVRLYYAPGDRRRRDADNLVPTLKIACDALVDAGIVPDDTPAFMDKRMPILVPGPDHTRAMWLTIHTTGPSLGTGTVPLGAAEEALGAAATTSRSPRS